MLVTDAMPQLEQKIPSDPPQALPPDTLEYLKTGRDQDYPDVAQGSGPLQVDDRATWPHEAFLSVNWLG
jgi:hypothetical protein